MQLIAPLKYFCVLLLIVLLCTGKNIQAQRLQQLSNLSYTEEFTYKLIDAPGKTYGYDIYKGGKLLIHQANIPAMPGNKGFATKKSAAVVAEYVIEKIKKGIMPPTISEKDLQKLKAIP